MKSIKTLMGMVAGGIGMLASFGLFLAGCDDDNSSECDLDQYKVNGVCTAKDPSNTVDAKLKECCGDDDGSAQYKACVSDYKASGACSGKQEPIYTEYGPAVVTPSEAEIAECCGDDKKADGYDACVQSYKDSGICSQTKPIDIEPTIYGPAPSACCGEGNEDTACGHIFFNTSVCSKDEGNEGLEACCGEKTGSDLRTCVNDYVKNKVCSGQEGPGDLQTDYGMPPLTDQEIADCCGNDKNADGYQECVSNYKET